jgi:two-component system sensor histidine kinase BarA
MTVFLEELGIELTAVDNGMEAIEMVKHNEFKLIFMDIRMPNMNGIQATAKIRAFEKANNRSSVPIIAMTAHAMMSERQGLLDVGIDDCLTKPIDELSLKSLIYHWMQRRHVEKVIDWDLASKLAGGKADLAKELFEKLLEHLPKEKEDINRAYILKDFEAMRDHVHHLHGGCCYCGVPILKRCAQSLETALASRTLEIIKTRLEALNKAIDDVLAYESIEIV